MDLPPESNGQSVELRTISSANDNENRSVEEVHRLFNDEESDDKVEMVQPVRKRPTFKTVGRALSTFLGVPPERSPDQYDASTATKTYDPAKKWSNRRYRLASRTYGGLRVVDQDEVDHVFPLRKKSSVASYAKEGIQRLTHKWHQVAPTSEGEQRSVSRSFQREPIDEVEVDQVGDDTFFDDKKPTDDFVDSSASQAVGQNRIGRLALAELIDNTDRREFGIGVAGRAFGRRFRESVRQEPVVRQQMDDFEDFRPYFTYWITTVQVIVVILSLCWYGFAPIGIELSLTSEYVRTEKLIFEQVAFYQPSSFWLGPRAADLIHLGAKFTPCMRNDEGISRAIEKRRTEESENTGCCVRNDESGCLQTTEDKCSKVLSTFYKWTPYKPGPDNRISGPVCGQDPRFCNSPASRAPFLWPDNISQWPICNAFERPPLGAPNHLTCQPTGKPCCVGIHGRCELRSEEYCNLVQGYFHPEANLCSQVSCMQDVCGMLPFMIDQDSPDQFYRMWTSLFLHAGLVHLTITVCVQIYLMRDLERMCGPLRMALIYLGSGIVGNLASAIFVPFRAESGPAGAQFGLLAALIVEAINVWPMLTRPFFAVGKLIGILLVLILFGFLPWVDNYAHVFGFISGLSLSFVLMPYMTFNQSGFFYSRKGRIVVIVVNVLIFLSLLVILLSVFYAVKIEECDSCKYFSCIPFTKKFCAEQNIDFAIREEYLGF